MNAEVNSIPAIETYYEVSRLLDFMVNKFIVRNGGDFEEYRAEANMIFVNVYDWWEPGNGSKFTSSVCNAVYRRLQYLRNREYARHHLHCASLDRSTKMDGQRTSWANCIADNTTEFDRESFEANLSSDACVVLRLLLDSPQEIVDIAVNKGGTPVDWRSAIRSYLSDIGWSVNRIKESFRELKES